MITRTSKVARAVAAAIAATAVTMIVPTGTAFAIDQVPCHPDEAFLKIWAAPSNGDERVFCYANAGKIDFGGWWVNKISTGNNDLIYYDANGDAVKIERSTEISFPNRPPKVAAIEIL